MLSAAAIAMGYIALVAAFGWTGLIAGALHITIMALSIRRK